MIEVDRTGRADFFTRAAFFLLQINTGVRIDRILQGNRLSIFHINGFSLGKAHVVRVFHFFGAFFRTCAAGNTFRFIDIAGILNNFDLEIAGFTADVFNFTKGFKLDIQVPADLDQFWGDNSHGAVIRRERLVQLGHDTADGWRFFK